MRLICPNCDAQYEIDASMLPPEGRDVQCSACGNVWFQTHSAAAAMHAEAWQTAKAEAAPPVQEARFLSDDDLEEEEDTSPRSPIEWQDAWDRAKHSSLAPREAPQFEGEPSPDHDPDHDPNHASWEPDAEPTSARTDSLTAPEKAADDMPRDYEDDADTPEAEMDVPSQRPSRTEAAARRALEALGSEEDFRITAPDEVTGAIPPVEAEHNPAPLPPSDPQELAPLAAPPAAGPRPRIPLPPEEDEDDWEEDLPPPAALANDMPPRRPKLDDDKLALLRDEVDRETRARAAEAARAQRGLEMQPDLGLPDAEPPVRLHIGPRVSQPETEEFAPAVGAAEPPRGPRRELLPDIERINQTLVASSSARGANLPPLASEQAQKAGFRRGFLLALILAVLLALIYQNADLLQTAIPAIAPLLEGYVAVVDSIRLGIDGLLRRLLDSQTL